MSIDSLSEQSPQLLLATLRQRLRRIVLSERAFQESVEPFLARCEELGVTFHVTIENPKGVLGSYGSESVAAPKKDTKEAGEIKFQYSAAIRGGKRISNAELDEYWSLLIPHLHDVCHAHWNDREGVSALRTAQDGATWQRLAQSVYEAATSGNPVVYARLDIDGFGAAKNKHFGGADGPANELMHRIALFYRQQLADVAIVTHPHGDEFTAIFLEHSIEEALAKLREFQIAFSEQDFRPEGGTKVINLGVKMALVASAPGTPDQIPESLLADIKTKADAIDFKRRELKNAIWIVEDEHAPEAHLNGTALKEAIVIARESLPHSTDQLGTALHRALAKWLVETTSDDLSASFEEIRRQFQLVFYANRGRVVTSTSKHALTKYIHSAQLAAILLHALLSRAVRGVGPLAVQDTIRIRVRTVPALHGRIWKLAIERSRNGDWEEVIACSNIASSSAFETPAGMPWIAQSGGQLENKTVVERFYSDAPFLPPMPCLAVCLGSNAYKRLEEIKHWFAATIALDDRPVTSGHLPDFWQSNVARIIAECIRNPNIRDILLIGDNQDAASNTREVLREACHSQGEDGRFRRHAIWSPNRISAIAAATTVREPLLRSFSERNIRIHEVRPTPQAILDATYQCCIEPPRHLSVSGTAASALRTGDPPNESTGPKYVFKDAYFGDAYPKIISALRHIDAPRYLESNSRWLAELVGPRIEITSATQFLVPAYWASDADAFQRYYERAFGLPDGLFRRRFEHWGEIAGGPPGTDQLAAGINEAVESIRARRLNRRIMLVTSQPPADPRVDPLGLVSVHALPRWRSSNGSARWHMDFVWVWRSVEALVGLPFSVFGSVRFSEAFTNTVRNQLNAEPIALGAITYLPISLHLYCDDSDLAIARAIDLGARP
jgi:GGDEF domain-containing protein